MYIYMTLMFLFELHHCSSSKNVLFCSYGSATAHQISIHMLLFHKATWSYYIPASHYRYTRQTSETTTKVFLPETQQLYIVVILQTVVDNPSSCWTHSCKIKLNGSESVRVDFALHHHRGCIPTYLDRVTRLQFLTSHAT